MKKQIFLTLIGVACSASLWAQLRYRASIRDAETQAPLENASVTFPGRDAQLKSNERGIFTINLNADSVQLRVSMLGYQTLDTVLRPDEGATMPVLLIKRESRLLQEVRVSTGYEQISKERSTGSFASVNNELFNQQVTTDVLSRLEAVTNGLMVDRGTGPSGQITIRGLSTIGGPRDPLIVVNNFPYEGDIDNINPNDIEDITVLRDAAAASIWGARASNGVIVIKLKEGKKGQPTSIGFNVNTTVTDLPDLHYVPQMRSSDFIEVERMLHDNNFYQSDINNRNRMVLSPVVELLEQVRMGNLSQGEADRQIEGLRHHDIRDDFLNHVYQRAVRQQYAFNANGAADRLTWLASVGYDRNSDELSATYDRLNLRMANSYELTDKIRLSASVLYTMTSQESGKEGYGDVRQKNNFFLPYTRLVDEAGRGLPVPRQYRMNFIDTLHSGSLMDWMYYPMEDYQHQVQRTDVSDVLVDAGLDYRVMDGLRLSLKYQFEQQSTQSEQLFGEQSYFARDLINRFSQVGADGSVDYIVPRGAVRDLRQDRLRSHNARAQLNFDKAWDKHEVTFLAGGEWRSANRTSERNRLYGFNPDILTWGTVNYNIQYPHLITGSNSFILPNVAITDRTNNFVSMFANGAYTYDQKYTLSLSARNDASNLFGLNTNDQWNPFWSTGLAWKLSDEAFYPDYLPNIRLRSTVGFSGNVDPAMVAITTIGYFPRSPYTNTPWARFDNYFNPELRWETSRMWNFGMDIDAVNDRIKGSIEYYQRKSFDLFGSSVIDYTAGVGNAITRNVARVQSRGLDLQLTTLNLQGAFRWESTLNFSINRDRVLENYLRYPAAWNYVSEVSVLPGLPDRAIYPVMSFSWGGLDPENGNPIGYLNGEASQDYLAIRSEQTTIDDLVYHGSAMPTHFGNFLNSFSYKGFSMSFSVLFKMGYYFRRPGLSYGNLFSQWNGHEEFADRWQQPGDELRTNVPSMVYPANSARDLFYQSSAALVERGDHIRLQFVNLAYNIQSPLLDRLSIKSLQVFANAANLGILWRANELGIDPDFKSRIDIPNPRSLSFGLRTTLN